MYELIGTNVSTNYIVSPVDSKQTLAVKLPFLVLILKNVSQLYPIATKLIDQPFSHLTVRR